MAEPLILLTNDDGIASPGLAAAAYALDGLGELLIVAPADQQTSMGRSRTLLPHQNGKVKITTVHWGVKEWPAYSVNATPALVVDVAVQKLASRPVLFAVSGINYGENIGTCITISGTIGAAMEAAERGIHSLAVSLETPVDCYYHHDASTDFTPAAYFTRLFTEKLINKEWPPDIDVFKIEIPATATQQTPWMITSQDRISYYTPQIVSKDNIIESPLEINHSVAKGRYQRSGSDANALALGKVSITPLSLDHTSRVAFPCIQNLLKAE